MKNNEPIGGSVFVNADTGETTVVPYTQEQIDEMIEIGLIKDEADLTN